MACVLSDLCLARVPLPLPSDSDGTPRPPSPMHTDSRPAGPKRGHTSLHTYLAETPKGTAESVVAQGRHVRHLVPVESDLVINLVSKNDHPPKRVLLQSGQGAGVLQPQVPASAPTHRGNPPTPHNHTVCARQSQRQDTQPTPWQQVPSDKSHYRRGQD